MRHYFIAAYVDLTYHWWDVAGSIIVKQIGHAVLTVDLADGKKEEYLITLPRLRIDGLWYGSPYIELAETSYIQGSTGYLSTVRIFISFRSTQDLRTYYNYRLNIKAKGTSLANRTPSKLLSNRPRPSKRLLSSKGRGTPPRRRRMESRSTMSPRPRKK